MTLEQHLHFLSSEVWKHVIVLFTSTEPCDEKSLENQVRRRPDLKQLLARCHNRYHFLDINNQSDDTQVIALLEKIEKMVAQNNGHHFKIVRNICVADEREKVNRERANQRSLAVKKQRAGLRAQIRASDGCKDCDTRSSVGNILLGKEAFRVDGSRTTVCCEIKHAEVYGRQLTVVDTPGWFCNVLLESTSELDKLEIRRSVCSCPPGPHVILLTVPIAVTYDKTYNKAVEEHMSLLGKKVWSHTIVLFTRGDWLGDTTIEERTEDEGKQLRWLIKKCGKDENGQKKHDESEKAKRYPSRTAKGKEIRSLGCEDCASRRRSSWKKHVRKHHFARTFFEKMPEEDLIVRTRTTQCVMKQGQTEGCQVSVVDTPGWSTSTLENAKEILHSMTVCSPGPHAFLLVLPVCESFTKRSQQTAEELMSLFGDNAWKHTIVLFTYGNWLMDRTVEEYIACEGKALQELIERKCGNRYRVLNNDWTNRFQVKHLLKMIEHMVARNRGEHFTLENKESTPTTTVHQTFNETLEEEWKKHEDELIERMLEAATADLDEETDKLYHKQEALTAQSQKVCFCFPYNDIIFSLR